MRKAGNDSILQIKLPLNNFSPQIGKDLLLTGELNGIRVHAVVRVVEDKLLQPLSALTTSTSTTRFFSPFADFQVGYLSSLAHHVDNNGGAYVLRKKNIRRSQNLPSKQSAVTPCLNHIWRCGLPFPISLWLRGRTRTATRTDAIFRLQRASILWLEFLNALRACAQRPTRLACARALPKSSLNCLSEFRASFYAWGHLWLG